MLLWVDGFERYGTSMSGTLEPVGILARRYESVGNTNYQKRYFGRWVYPNRSLRMYTSNSTYFMTPALTTNATLILGVAFQYVDAAPSDGTHLIAFQDGATLGINIRSSGLGDLGIWLGANHLESSVGLNLLNNIWYYLELKVICNNSTGSYTLRINGTDALTASGVDTKEGSNDYHDKVRLYGFGTSPSRGIAWDDLYICDSIGSYNNNLLGNQRVETLYPSSDDTTDWTPSAGVDNADMVDENPCDDDTTYVEDSTVNHADLYNYANLDGLTTVSGLQICTEVRETSANTSLLITVIDSNGTSDEDAGTTINTTSYISAYWVTEEDPDISAAWTQTSVDAAKIGIKVG